MFISPLLDIAATERIFRKIKSRPRILAFDMKEPTSDAPLENNFAATERILAFDATRPKNGETLKDLATILSYADYFFPNEEELATLTGSDDLYKNIDSLLDCGLKCAVVKRGGDGCIIATKNERLEIPACHVEKVVDTTGAGDCFAAGFLYALSEDWPLAECGKFACAVASCSVEEVGAVAGVTSLEKVLQRYERSISFDKTFRH